MHHSWSAVNLEDFCDTASTQFRAELTMAASLVVFCDAASRDDFA
jgi:hypothetical protein